jgi:hypothetical protein
LSRFRSAGSRTCATIGVAPTGSYHRLKRLFDALAEYFAVTFVPRSLGSFDRLDGLILPGTTRELAVAAARSGLPCYAVLVPAASPVAVGNETVRFEDCTSLPAVLRNRSLQELEHREVRPLRPEAGEQVLASKAGHAIWLHRQEAAQGVHLVSLEPPALEATPFLSEYFDGNRFLSLLPLLHFLRELTGGMQWQAPPLRACFVFDDPSLHWSSYGCIRFPELAKHAAAHNYHAAIATIPLDAWWVDARVAGLFRSHSSRLSLLIHGNEHTRLEMARTRGETDHLGMLAEALRRVQALEVRHGLEVCRVMEAPHGMVSCELFDGLIALGYEAALVTTRQFLQCNRSKPCPAGMGLDSVECLPGGLCGISRIVMSPRWKTEAVLAAFLGQPVVIAGHHHDVRDGLAALADMAATVNGLGPVEWRNVSQIARMHYMTKREGDQLVVRLGSRRVVVHVPAGVQSITVERSWLNDGDEEPLAITAAGAGETMQRVFGNGSERIPVSAPSIVELISPAPTALRLPDAPVPPRRIWPIVRRVLTEMRDRAYPYVPRPVRKRPAGKRSASNSSWIRSE